MATAVLVVKQSLPAPDEDTPLLGGAPTSTSDVTLVSPLTAHRRRCEALLRAVWDSGVACVCGAALVFSFAAFFVKLLGAAIPVFQIVAFRSLASFAVCAAYARAARISPLFGRRANLRFLLSRGLFGAAAMTSYYFSIRLLPLADAVTLFFLNPAITAVAAWAIMREPLGLRGVAGVVVSLAGLVLLTRPPFLFGSGDGASGGDGIHGDGAVGIGTAGSAGSSGNGGWDKDRLLGSLFGLLSALLSAGAFVSIRYIGKSEPALVVSVYFHVAAATSSLVPLAAGVPAPAVWPDGRQWGLLLGVACCSFWGQILIGRGFQLLHAARASAINLTQVVYSYVLGLLFLHERLTLTGGGGSVLIAAGAVLVNLRPKKAPTQTPAEGGGGADSAATAAAGAVGKEGVADGGRGADSAISGSSTGSGISGGAGASEDCGEAGPREDRTAVAVVEMSGLRQGGSSGLGGDDGGGEGGVKAGRQRPWRLGPEEESQSERRPLLPSPAELTGGGAGGGGGGRGVSAEAGAVGAGGKGGGGGVNCCEGRRVDGGERVWVRQVRQGEDEERPEARPQPPDPDAGASCSGCCGSSEGDDGGREHRPGDSGGRGGGEHGGGGRGRSDEGGGRGPCRGLSGCCSAA